MPNELKKLIEEAHNDMCDPKYPDLLCDYLKTNELDNYLKSAYRAGLEKAASVLPEEVFPSLHYEDEPNKFACIGYNSVLRKVKLAIKNEIEKVK